MRYFKINKCLLSIALLFFASIPGIPNAAPLPIAQAPFLTGFASLAPNLIFMLDNSGSMQWEYLGDLGNISWFDYGFPPGTSQPYGHDTYTSFLPGYNPKKVSGDQYRSAFVNPNYYNPSITYQPWACPASYPENSGTQPSFTTPSGQTCIWNNSLNEWLWPNANPAQSYLSPERPKQGYRDLEVWNDSQDYTNETANNGYIGSKDISNESWCVYTSGSSTNPCKNDQEPGPYYNPQGIKTNGNTTYPYGFWPAVYYNYTGTRAGQTSVNSGVAGEGSYQEVQICPAASFAVTAPTKSGGTVSFTGCQQPPALPNTVTSSDDYHTYTITSGTYTNPEGHSITCGTGSSACYAYVEPNGSSYYLLIRTYTEEMQNFANWYQYYRSHVLMAKAAISQATMNLPSDFRVDYSLLNNMSQNTNNSTPSPELATTSDFSLVERTKFLNDVFSTTIPRDGTPSREALYNMIQWLSAPPSSSAPWGTSATESAANNGASYLSCRQNYLVFVTDGGWNGQAPPINNADGSTGPKISGPGNQSYQYSPIPPYEDVYSTTFADVAFSGWETDLQPGMTNNVPTNSADPAFWQHLVTFDVGLGVMPGLVSQYMLNNPQTTEQQAQQDVYQEILSGKLAWPQPNGSNCPSGNGCLIDDLWHGGIDGHGSFFSAQNPIELANSLKNTLTNIINRTQSSSSVTTNVQKNQQVQTETEVFQSVYHPDNWWGELFAYPILVNQTTGTASIGQTPTWDGSCVLTGTTNDSTACPTPGNSYYTAPSNRTILTWNGTEGIPFEPTAPFTSSQLQALGSASVIDYLRGIRTDEQDNGGILRTRTSVLGDIVHSSPTWVGYPNNTYPTTTGENGTWQDMLYPNQSIPENSGQSYESFVNSEQSRLNVVYVGANDGFLHGFAAGNYTSSNGQLLYNNATNNGKEVLAYMPSAVINEIAQYTNPNYNHHYFVDTTPGTGDLYYEGAWHTWLVSGIGAGGKDIFALNITNPSNFSEKNAANIVIADWTPSNLTCVNDTQCAQDLGYTYGTPTIRLFHNGDWGVIWGNGLNSTNGKAGIFIGLINSTTGKWTIYFLNTGSGTTANPDGIIYATPADLDGDHFVDYIYAGDYDGNIWRFNVTSSNPSDWHVSTYGNNAPTPLYTALNANGTAQPITTKVLAVQVPTTQSNHYRLLIEFGTGSNILTTDGTPNLSPGGVQSIYGIWDWDLTNWNNGYTTQSGVKVSADPVQYESMDTSPGTLTLSNLQEQAITAELNSSGQTYTGNGTGNRIISNNTVCWAGSNSSCPTGDTTNAYGWYLNLVSPNQGRQGEKVIYNPILENGVFIVNTLIPGGSAGLTCQPVSDSGWTMDLNPATGGSLPFSIFYDKNGNLITLNDRPTSGITYNAVGTPSFVIVQNKKYAIFNSSLGKLQIARINLGTGNMAGRLTWTELR